MELFDSTGNWIMALGKTMVHSIWIGLLFLSALKIALLLIPSRFSGHRYRAAFITFLLFSGSVATTFMLLYTPGPQAPGALLHLDAPQTLISNGLANSTGWIVRACYYGTYLYFTGILCFIIHSVFSLWLIRKIRKNGEQAAGIWVARFDRMIEQAGIRSKVRLLVSTHAQTPFLTGIIRPLVIVPAGMLTQLPFGQVEAILMHELFHLRRYDHIVNLIQRIIEIVLFYNPAAWSISGIIRRERENCCDDMVLNNAYPPLDYARALYLVALDPIQRSVAMQPAATGNNRWHLKHRIQRILNPSTMKTNIRERLYAILLLTGGLLIVLVISGFTSSFSISKYQTATEKVVQPVKLSDPDPPPVPVPLVEPVPVPAPG